MADDVKTIGFDLLANDIEQVRRLLQEPELITAALHASMSKFVHVETGRLKKSLYHKGNIAGAKAPYAGDEEEREGDHAYATRAIKAFDVDKYADEVLGPL